jgi:hypothetical protein
VVRVRIGATVRTSSLVRRTLPAVGVVAAILGVVALVLTLVRPVPPSLSPPPVDTPDELALHEFPLTGVLTDVLPQRPALIVKVSNSPEARPQTGLDRADVVLEELTEGGVTRFVAVLHSDLPDVIGPVRSARPVDAQIVSGFGIAGVAYSGARPEVRALFSAVPAISITEGAPGFFRDDGTYASHPFAPHDLFLRTTEGLAAVEAGGARPLTDLGWVFSDEPPPGGGAGVELEVEMSRAFTTGWRYDGASYRRSQNGVPSTVTGAGSIAAANVVVLAVRHYIGASGYPETDVLGTGEATVLRDGRRYPARWTKASPVAPLALFDAAGDPFPLARGSTWILLPDHLPG